MMKHGGKDGKGGSAKICQCDGRKLIFVAILQGASKILELSRFWGASRSLRTWNETKMYCSKQN